MVDFNTGDWFGLSQDRKTVRDQVRSEFWSNAGVDPHTSSSSVSYAPQEQRVSMIGLLKVTRDGGLDAGHTAFLTTMARALAGAGLGKGAMGGVARNIVDIAQYDKAALGRHFLILENFEGSQGRAGGG